MTRDAKTDEQAIRQVITTWMRASAEGDLEALAPLMADDVVFLTPGNPPMRGRDAFLAAFRTGMQQVQIDATSDVQEINVAGDLAYCWSRLQVTMTPGGGAKPTSRRGHVLSVFRREWDGRWVLFRDANMITAETQR